MSLSSCPHCYDTPCTCGYEWRKYTREERLEQAAIVLGVSYRVLKCTIGHMVPDVHPKLGSKEEEFLPKYLLPEPEIGPKVKEAAVRLEAKVTFNYTGDGPEQYVGEEEGKSLRSIFETGGFADTLSPREERKGRLMKLSPLNDKVILKQLEAQEKSPGGIVIPDSAKERPKEGRVVAAGPGRVLKDGTRVEMPVKVGDRVLFGPYSGNPIKVEEEEYLFVSEAEILAIIEETDMDDDAKTEAGPVEEVKEEKPAEEEKKEEAPAEEKPVEEEKKEEAPEEEKKEE